MAEYFAMGGYGAFIWPAYGVTAVVLIGIGFASWRGYRSRQRLLSALQDSGEPT